MNRCPTLLLAASTALSLLTTNAVDARAQSASQEIERVVVAFHSALAAGDSTTALGYLAEDVIILESGGTETKEQYRSGHLSGDMRFAQAVPQERGELDVRLVGEAAWAHSTSIRQGRIGEREINSQSAELVVLAREEGTWKIKAIHWSSRNRR